MGRSFAIKDCQLDMVLGNLLSCELFWPKKGSLPHLHAEMSPGVAANTPSSAFGLVELKLNILKHKLATRSQS